MKQYKHIFDALVNGEQIEHLIKNGFWDVEVPERVLYLISKGCQEDRLRIKPKTININGHEVPEAVRQPLNDGDSYYVPSITDPELFQSCVWDDFDIDRRLLADGLIHIFPESAVLHARALLSFTKSNDDAEP